MTTDNNTAAALAYAEAHAYPLVLDLGDDRIIVRNPLTGETEQVDKRPESEGPRRQESVRAVHDADSFVLAVTRYTPEDVCPLCAEAERRGLLPDPTEPTTCTCETPNPDGLGECRTCRRLVVEGES